MQNLGWHNFSNELMLFHGALKQFLQEPAVNLEKMKKEAVSMKVFIETVIDTPKETSDES
jgi:hypothetical protein